MKNLTLILLLACANAAAQSNVASGLRVLGTNAVDVVIWCNPGSVQTKLFAGADSELVLEAEDGTPAFFTVGNINAGNIVASDYHGSISGATNGNASTIFSHGTVPFDRLGGLTVNVNVIVAGGKTNQLQFRGGVLTGIVPVVTPQSRTK